MQLTIGTPATPSLISWIAPSPQYCPQRAVTLLFIHRRAECVMPFSVARTTLQPRVVTAPTFSSVRG